jgi:hypothetical protein
MKKRTRISRLIKRLRDFAFFLNLNHSLASAWELSGKTIS